MNFETVVQDVKGRLDTVGSQAQDAAKHGVETFKASSDLVINSVQGLVKTHTGVAKELAENGKASFDKAVKDGLVAVAKNPADYVPAGRDKLVGAFNETVSTVSATGEKLAKVIKTGVNDITVVIKGEQGTVKPAAKRATKTVKTAAKRTSAKATAAKKSATGAARKATTKAKAAASA